MNEVSSENLNFYPYKIFEDQGELYLYTVNQSGLFKIDNKTIAILNQDRKEYTEAFDNVSSLLDKQEFDELLQKMKDVKFIESPENDNLIKTQLHKEIEKEISSLTLMIVQECNMKCSYCYGEGGEYYDKGKMSLETAIQSIEYLITNSKSEKLLICLFGGEPLLNFDLFKAIISYCRSREEQTGKTFSFTTTTNGTLLTKEIEEYLVNNKVTVQISVDGDQNTHNSNRYFDNKIGSYEIIIRRTKNMRQKGLLTARATITNKQFDLVETFNHLHELGFRAIPMSPAFNLLSDDDYKTLTAEYYRLIDHFEHLIKENDYVKYSKLSILNGFMHRINKGYVRSLPCGVGRSMYAIDINGDIYPCHRFVSNKEYILGNVYTSVSRREAFLEEINVDNHKKCGNCWARNLCIGGCPNENLMSTGSVGEMTENICELTRNIYEKLIKVYLRLTNEEKERLFNTKNNLTVVSKV
ncbi:uncharacterized protein SAMN04488542_10957 [Fontibacillus panacisegetis]|uniref:Radical SAM core domain-containing protein n=1 Tax=Fontibacillus panacisegetis TaxID=670482 RepID=A0A1G7K905_9BACL|nr:SPASM domain-containing protein [Fontibacillus panacisegetis]SDF33627.1 uncharacterized protein SAMN04488542_10957 [Fontibacillus panacisegetis]